MFAKRLAEARGRGGGSWRGKEYFIKNSLIFHTIQLQKRDSFSNILGQITLHLEKLFSMH